MKYTHQKVTYKNKIFKYSKIALVCSALLAGNYVYSQEDNGGITGVVTGVQGISPVEGAIVRIKELNREAISNSDGTYRFKGIPPGTYTLVLDYLGADSQEFVVTVGSGESASQSMSLTGSTIEVIEVSSNFAGLNSARNMQRASDTVKDIVDSNAAGQFADQNIAESLQRLPGVNIDRSEGEGRFVTIRGLGPEFNSVSINGVTVGTSSSGFGLTGSGPSRAVTLDTIPSDLLETIEVSKTRTPDMDGDSIGGSVDLRALSAFDRGGRSISFRAEGSYSEQAEETSPKASFRFTDFLGEDKKWGIAIAGSYFNRKIAGDELRNDNGLAERKSYVDASTFLEIEDSDARPEFLRIEEIDQRRELGERERYGYTVNVDYRPNDDSQYFFRYTGSQLSDDDTRIQQEWELRDAGGTSNENLFLENNGGIVTDIDLEKQIFFQNSKERVDTFSIGGKHFLDNWTLDYQAAYSKNEFDNSGVRGRHRERDNAVQWSIIDPYTVSVNAFFADKDLPPLSEASSSDIRGDIRELDNFDFDNFLYIEDKSEDEVTSFEFNAARFIEVGGMYGEIQMGVKSRVRTKTNDRVDEFSADPSDNPDDFIPQNLTDWTLFNPNSSLFGDEFANFPALGEFRSYMFSNIALARQNRETNPGAASNTVRGDYEAEENILSAYLMGTLDVNDEVKVIGGFRVERTKFDGSAFLARRISVGGDLEDKFDDALQGLVENTTSEDYTDVLPSLHLRYEPTDDIVVRASYTEAIQRPSFFQAIPRQDIVVDIDGDELDDFEVEAEISAGNVNLQAAQASQWDASIAWYPNETTYLSIGVFHKTIDNFFARTTLNNASDISAFGFTGEDFQLTNNDPSDGEPILQTFPGQYTELDITINGDDATVSGLEFAYSQKFQSGIFIDSNFAILDSEAKLGEPRPDEKLPLPNQADGTANVSLGWEKEGFSVRASWNWRDEILASVNSNPEEDRIREAYDSVDVNIKYNINENYQVYFDAINITEEQDIRLFRGNEQTGRLFSRIEDYGSTFQIGISGNF